MLVAPRCTSATPRVHSGPTVNDRLASQLSGHSTCESSRRQLYKGGRSLWLNKLWEVGSSSFKGGADPTVPGNVPPAADGVQTEIRVDSSLLHILDSCASVASGDGHSSWRHGRTSSCIPTCQLLVRKEDMYVQVLVCHSSGG